MKNAILRLSIFSFFLLLLFSGCEEENIELIDEYYPFKLHYVVHDANGQEITQVKEGESFYVSFSIKNLSDTTIKLISMNLRNDELFNLYKYNSKSKNYEIIEPVVEDGWCLGINYSFKGNSELEETVIYPVLNDTTTGLFYCSYNLKKNTTLAKGEYLIKYSGNIKYNYSGISSSDESDTGNFNIQYKFEIVE